MSRPLRASPRATLTAAFLPLGGCMAGHTEWLVILLIVLVLFGASRLPALGRALGETLRSFRSATSDDDDEERKGLSSKEPARIEEARTEKVEAPQAEAQKVDDSSSAG